MQVNSKAVAKYERPKCAACDFGKVHCRFNKVNTIKKNNMNDHKIKRNHLLPGNMVSVDYYIPQAPGRLYKKKEIISI